MTTEDTNTDAGRASALERGVRRLLAWVRQHLCNHRFAIEDLAMVNRDSDGDDRVAWPCDKCGEVFRAHCGLYISPGNGPTFRRAPPNVRVQPRIAAQEKDR